MRKAFFAFLITAGALSSAAQTFTTSPYSRYGVGELNFQGFTEQQGMGQLSIADRSPLRYSIANPASYSAIRMTNFRFGGAGSVGSMQENNQSLPSQSVSFGYLTLGFQVDKKKTWGVVFGIIPYSSTGYNIEYSTDSSFGRFTNRFSGAGGLSRYFLGTGKRFGNGFSIGLQGSFLMGLHDISKEMLFPAASTYMSYKENSTNYLKGFYLDAGIQYELSQSFFQNAKKRERNGDSLVKQKPVQVSHVIGLTYQLPGRLNGKEEFFSRSIATQANQSTKDTILFATLGGVINLPSSLGFGYMISEKNGLWRAGIEYRQNAWSEYSSAFNTFRLKSSFQASAGFAWRFTTDFENTRKNFLQKTEYRLGARYNSGIIHLNGQNISEFGISLGFGLPLRMRPVTEEFKYETVFSSIDFSLEYLQRGTLSNNLIREEYLRFTIGVSLNDKWFNKRKIE
jgi:hypothetical protein